MRQMFSYCDTCSRKHKSRSKGTRPEKTNPSDADTSATCDNQYPFWERRNCSEEGLTISNMNPLCFLARAESSVDSAVPAPATGYSPPALLDCSSAGWDSTRGKIRSLECQSTSAILDHSPKASNAAGYRQHPKHSSVGLSVRNGGHDDPH
jgi:hypothetical protein